MLVIGIGPLADIMCRAAEIRGANQDIVLIAHEVRDHKHLENVTAEIAAWDQRKHQSTIVITSQVPPGFSRQWNNPNIFCQPHVMRRGQELADAVFPDCLVAGCADASKPLPSPYKLYLDAFKCPVVQTDYETAELSKLAMNYMLAMQLEATNRLAEVAGKVKADWTTVTHVLKADKRIGRHAYLTPGAVGGHLPRDVRTVEKLLSGCGGLPVASPDVSRTSLPDLHTHHSEGINTTGKT